MRRVAALVFATTCVLATNLHAQDVAPYLLLSVDDSCADSEQSQSLQNALKLRIPETEIRSDRIEQTNPIWTVTWRIDPKPDDPERCVLDFSSADYNSSMTLTKSSTADEITLAASRVAWLAGMRSPVPDPPVETPIEETPAEQPEEPEPSEESPPEPEPEEEEKEEPEAEVKVETPPVEPKPVQNSVPWKISILPSLEYFGRDVPRPAVAQLSLNALAGVGEGLNGFEFGLGYNGQTGNVSGVQMALGANSVDGIVKGGQFAIGANMADSFDGGFQLAIGANVVRSDSLVVQAGVANIARGKTRGVQFGVANVNTESLAGFQFGAVNVAGDVGGVQFSVLNVGREIDGVQVGLVNVAKTSDLSLGLVNVLWGEPLFVTAFVTSALGIYAGLQHGGRYLRYGLFVGALTNPGATLLEVGVALGLHIGDKIFWDTDAMIFQGAIAGESIERGSFHGILKTAVGYQLKPRLALFAGVDANLVYTGDPNPFEFLPDAATLVSDVQDRRKLYAWPGVHVGVRF